VKEAVMETRLRLFCGVRVALGLDAAALVMALNLAARCWSRSLLPSSSVLPLKSE